MSQSKMAAAEGEKKFTMRHTFENVWDIEEGQIMNGPIENHFDIPWKMRIRLAAGYLKVFLDCMLPSDEAEDWSIDTHTAGKLIRKSDEVEYQNLFINFNTTKTYVYYVSHRESKLLDFLNDGRYVFEFTVIILKTAGVPHQLETPRPRIFDDEAAKKMSDVTLIVGDQKFHVLKNLLAAHSTYFKALFSGNFSDTQKSEIELKEIDPNDFQNFLEFLYLESCIEDHSVLGILQLADFFDSKTVVRRCQKFLVEKSKLPYYQKYEAAIKYNLEELKTKCMTTAADLRQIVP